MKPTSLDRSSEQTTKQHLSILIVDDESSVLDMLTVILNSFGHEVIARASKGADAIRMAREHQPDLIILDVGMPDMDGITVAEQILAEQSVPIIIETGLTEEELVERASRLDIQSFLIKPFGKEQLQATIRLAMSRHRESQAAKNTIAQLTGELEATRTINNAVELLIQKFGIDRAEAMEKLEAAAKARSCSVTDAAKAISATLKQS